MVSLSMDRQRISMNLLSSVVLLCCLTFAVADVNSETCQRSDSSDCSTSSTQRRAKSMEYVNYALEKGDEELEEGVNDADLINHMQMRLNVEIPHDPEAVQAVKKAGAQMFQMVDSGDVGQAEMELKELQLLKELQKLSSGEPATAVPVKSPAAAEAKPPPLMASTLSQTDPAAFLSGNQLLPGAVVGALLVILGAVLATAMRTFLTGRKNVSDDEIRTAGKAWMLDWALGYEPDDKEEEPEIQEMKVQAKKKMPPVTTASDSGDTDEEEPEAESDSGEVLEDAIFVAQQVEVANQAMDAGYGLEENARLVDQIRR